MATRKATKCIIATLTLLVVVVFVQPATIPNGTETTSQSTSISSLNHLSKDEFEKPPLSFLSDSSTPLTTVDKTEVPTTALTGSSDAVTKTSNVVDNTQELLIPPATVNASIAQMHNTSHRNQILIRFVYYIYNI